jgi:putative membrane protein
LAHWAFVAVPVVTGAVALLLHQRGCHRVVGSVPGAVAQEWSYRAGVAGAVMLWVSPAGYWAGRELFARMGQDLVLAFVVAPMIVLGGPWAKLAAGISPRGPGALQAARRSPVWRVVASPVTALVGFLACFWVWHLPPVLDAAATSSLLHGLEGASYLVTGLALWGQLVGSHPFSPRLDNLGRVSLVAVALIGCFLPAAAMVFVNKTWYPAFRHLPGAVLSVGADQGMAAGLTWVLPVTSLGVVTLWTLTAWLNHDQDDDWRLAALVEETRLKMAAGASADDRPAGPIADRP